MTRFGCHWDEGAAAFAGQRTDATDALLMAAARTAASPPLIGRGLSNTELTEHLGLSLAP
ncbi:hypothetical protein ACFYO8_09945 [Micromonospora sp. NPDC005257]|uniref:hypothetical protein n=1 Tax=Micromonospora sp. NPDC005257 TaxID=3364230 RepID=UPI0036B36EE9